MAPSGDLLDFGTDEEMSSPTLGPSVFLTPPESNSPKASQDAEGEESMDDAASDDDMEVSADVKVLDKRKVQKSVFAK